MKLKDRVIFTVVMILALGVVGGINYIAAYFGEPRSLWLMQLLGVM
jgi:hypothetical protein